LFDFSKLPAILVAIDSYRQLSATKQHHLPENLSAFGSDYAETYQGISAVPKLMPGNIKIFFRHF
jgi:hypothetical protein